MKTFRTANRRRATIGLTGVALAVAMTAAACGSSGSPSSNGNGPVTLTVTGWYGNNTSTQMDAWWNAAAAAFKKTHPNVTVKIDNIVTSSESTYYSKLDLMERSSSTSPNLVYEDSFLVDSDAAAGYLAPLPQLKNFAEWQGQYPTFKSMTEYNGVPYAMMTETDAEQVYFDKALLAKAGLPANWKPTSLNSILTAAEAIKAKDPGVIPLWIYTGTPLGEATSFRGFELELDGTSSQLYDTATGKWETGGPGFDQVFNFLQELHSKGLEEPTSDWSTPTGGTIVNTQLMPAQQVAMVIDGSWVSSEWQPGGAKPWSAGDTTYSVADIPTASGQAPGVTNLSGGWSLAIPAKSSNQSLAYQFLETANSPSLLATYDGTTGQIPVEGNVASNPTFTSAIKSDPLFQQAVSYAAHTNYRPAFGPYNQISTDIAQITGEISLGQLTAAQAEAQYASDVTQAAGPGNTQG
jgi:multiple sugar transport system substrate-binding protein